VDEPRTHYQVSFTSRQGLAVFGVLVAAIVLAYFLGLMTGLAGREARLPSGAAASPTVPAAVAAVTPAQTPEAAFPVPVLGVAGRARASRTSLRPTEPPAAVATPVLQLFEDRASSEPTRAPAPAARPAPGKSPAKATEASGFWVQVDSLSSKEQAETRRRGLGSAGFKAAVVPGTGPKGVIYRVRVGPYASREEADRAAESLARKAKVARPWVVPPGQ
jgi:cell division septation protein DedD